MCIRDRTWTDPPGFVLATKQLVNDLDLSLRASDASLNAFGNGGSSVDTVNVAESIERSMNAGTIFNITVDASKVTANSHGSAQPFALVVTGEITLIDSSSASLVGARFLDTCNDDLTWRDRDGDSCAIYNYIPSYYCGATGYENSCQSCCVCYGQSQCPPTPSPPPQIS
eukprot:1491956-Prymnesium_polylepis.1